MFLSLFPHFAWPSLTRLGMCFSLFVQCRGGGSLPRTVSPLFTVLWGLKMQAPLVTSTKHASGVFCVELAHLPFTRSTVEEHQTWENSPISLAQWVPQWGSARPGWARPRATVEVSSWVQWWRSPERKQDHREICGGVSFASKADRKCQKWLL